MNPQIRMLLIAYSLTAGAMLLVLLLRRAQPQVYWRWPVYSAMVLALGVVLWNLLRNKLLPADWVLTHPALLYYGALALYATLGALLGLVLPRRRDDDEEDGRGDATSG